MAKRRGKTTKLASKTTRKMKDLSVRRKTAGKVKGGAYKITASCW